MKEVTVVPSMNLFWGDTREHSKQLKGMIILFVFIEDG